MRMMGVWVLVAWSGVAQAQYRNPYNNQTFNNVYSRNLSMFSSMQQNLFHQMNQINASRHALSEKLGAKAPPAAPIQPPHKPLSATDFKPADKGHPVIERFLVSINVSDADRATTRTVMEENFKLFEKDGRKNNVATSIGIAVATSVWVLTGQEIGDADSDKLVQIINDNLAASPQFKKLSARDKQTLSDSMLLTAALMINLARQDDPQIKQASAVMAREVLARFVGAPTGG